MDREFRWWPKGSGTGNAAPESRAEPAGWPMRLFDLNSSAVFMVDMEGVVRVGIISDPGP